ncbi:hypothetical protein AB5J56_29360 [Streptomyces sp. R21]|uniref:Uncharacterized protein n=1 Tax=Streptomyces sp. R21 TaxID=3238627 RepID=A0AB39PCJ4_9ACTN
MANPRKMYCETCGHDETHRTLTKTEQDKLRNSTGRKYIGDFFVCDCGTLRTGLSSNPFDRPRKLKD